MRNSERFCADLRDGRHLRHRYGDRGAAWHGDRRLSHRALSACLTSTDRDRSAWLAGIPSIIYGIWGLFVFAPFLQTYLQPFVIEMFSNVPVLNSLFAGPPYGIGILTAALILAIMVVPFVASISRDVFETVPPMLKESAYGVGCTTWEVVRNIVIPYTRVGVIGGVMLGLGRALGETMAVTFVIGNAHRISGSLLAPGTTISASIANEFTEAVGDLYTSSLIALGLILFMITFIVLASLGSC